jgi:hypothetical protein
MRRPRWRPGACCGALEVALPDPKRYSFRLEAWREPGSRQHRSSCLNAAGDEAASQFVRCYVGSCPAAAISSWTSGDAGHTAISYEWPGGGRSGRDPLATSPHGFHRPDHRRRDGLHCSFTHDIARSLSRRGRQGVQGFQRWIEDTELAGSIARFGNFKTFRLTPTVSDPTTVCAWRELAQMRADGLAEYRELVEALAADPIIGPRLGAICVSSAND